MTMINTLSIILIVSAVLANAELDLHLKPSRTFEKKTGDNFMIQCKIKDDDSESLHINVTVQPSWSFTSKGETTSKQISASGRYRVKFIDAYTSHLMITNADMSDAGSYECHAVANGRELKKDVSVTIYKSIELIDVQPNQHPIEGETAKIYCRTKADPVPEINWFRKHRASAEETEDPEKVVDTSPLNEKFSTEENGQILVIKNFDTSTDNGIYKCSVNQVESGDMKDLSINVTGYVKPQIKHVSEDPEFNEGAGGDIFCAASGVPTPHFNWFKNGLAILEGEEYQFPEPGLLRILKATKEDAGIFVCEAFNVVAKDKKDVTVIIFHLPSIVEAANVTIKREEPAQLDCAYTGGEPLTARWHSKHGEIPIIGTAEKESNDEQDFSQVHEHNRYAVIDNNRKIISLHIKNTSMDDGGEYQCRISNKAGNTTKAAYVLIERKPTLHGPMHPVVRATDNSVIELSCSVDALPDPAWSWQGPNGNIIPMGDNTLQITNSLDQLKSSLKFTALPEHYGQYKCTALNKHGEAQFTTNVLKIEQPKTPVVEALDSFPTKARLFIKNYVVSNEEGVESVAENERPTKVKITFYAKETEGAADRAEPILENFNPSGVYEVYKLQPQTSYVILVQGKNEGGESETARIDYATSEPQAPSSPAFITTNMTECLTSSCTVQWSIPDNSGEAITGYRVMYKPTKAAVMDQSPASEMESEQSRLESAAAAIIDEEKWAEGNVGPDVQQIELPNLRPKTVYVVRVYATNKIAPSLPSPDLYIKTREFGADVLQSGVNAGAIVAIVIIVVLIFVLLVDVACYYVNQCGLLMCLCVSCFGKASPEMKAKQMDTEQGKVMADDKKPLRDLEDVRGEQGEDAPMIAKEKVEALKKDTPV